MNNAPVGFVVGLLVCVWVFDRLYKTRWGIWASMAVLIGAIVYMYGIRGL